MISKDKWIAQYYATGKRWSKDLNLDSLILNQ